MSRTCLHIVLAMVFSILYVSLPSAAQDETQGELRLKIKAYRGHKYIVDEYGDTCLYTFIRDLNVYPPLKFKNKKQEEFYWRTVRDVRKTLPYAKLAFSALCETYEYIQTIPDSKERERHLKRLEKDIFEQYKPVVKTMTKKPGKGVAQTDKPRDRPVFVQYRKGILRLIQSRVLADIRQVFRHEHEGRIPSGKKQGRRNDRADSHAHRARSAIVPPCQRYTKRAKKTMAFFPKNESNAPALFLNLTSGLITELILSFFITFQHLFSSLVS